eukprot:CAMPEP_0172508634 /NCGR_PEP_ID=MMETSP1066-20121228/213479_1 /TAXON_ID=671091 /ORGANISM="Coscinodiscus wailesii, Strain CCMP2513" /LENGTH=367 /DNA_ID=CAMNT_0013286699 /DNA_START=12 /DNA_END=1115 /DNA_ORIENTATION=+
MSAEKNAPPTEQTTTTDLAADARYSFDATRLDNLRSRAPWKDNAKYFQKAALSPSATTKMMMHCHSGVEAGLAKGGNPIEKMGLLLGRPDPDTPRTLIVTDVFPLPIEGFETRVVADDQDVLNHIITLAETMEKTRKEKFMGWYHSHPFDVGIHSHCYLSQTDISTQLQWQRAEDPHGNPWLAIVIDPLRSLAKNNPEMKAFRVYPPDYKSAVTNECPDGSIVHDEQARLEKWGSCWSRYYELEVEYFMSANARSVIGILTQNYLWMRTLGSTTMLEAENRQRFPERVVAVAEKIKAVEVNVSGGAGGVYGGQQGRGMTFGATSAAGEAGRKEEEGELSKATRGVVELATEKLHGNIVQMVKKDLFC